MTWANGMTRSPTAAPFWRDGILIDTDYSNLAPEGDTDAIVDAIWG